MPERFLIARLSSLGDVVCSLPVATLLRAHYPESDITWAVDPRFAGIVECCTAVNHVVKCKPGFKPSSWPTFEGEFDAALDLQGLSKSAIVVARAKARQKVGYHWQREGAWLFSSAVRPDPTSLHVVDQYVDVARFLAPHPQPLSRVGSGGPDTLPSPPAGEGPGVRGNQVEFALKPKDEDLSLVRELLASKGVTGRFVLANAGAGWVSKRWPATSFAWVSDQLASKDIPMVFLGGKADEDKQTIEEVQKEAKTPVVSVVGETGVRQLVALCSLASAHLGGDTGSTHLAAALGIPAVGLYSITKPVRSCPYGQIDHCHYDPSGLAQIHPEDVLKTLNEVLSC